MYDIADENDHLCSVDEAVVTPDRIAFDWEEDYDKYVASLNSTDGFEYSGDYGVAGFPRTGKMKAWLYRAQSGDLLLWMTWTNDENGIAENYLISLTPPDEE